MMGEESDERFTPPSFDGLPLDQYLSPGLVLPYSASRGCYWRRCSFCPEKAEGTPYRPTPPDRVTAHLRELSSRHKPSLIHLVDNALSPALMTRIAESPFGVPWCGFARFVPLLADVDFCKALKASGCVMLKLGLESGDLRVLEALEKGLTPEKAARALAALKQAGVATYVYLLFGTPPETKASAQRTLDFVAAHSGSIDFLNIALFNLPVHCMEAGTLELRPSTTAISPFTPISSTPSAGTDERSGSPRQGIPKAPRHPPYHLAPTSPLHLESCPFFSHGPAGLRAGRPIGPSS